MSKFQLLDEKRYPLHIQSADKKPDMLPYYRWEHRATIGYKGKTYMVFIDNLIGVAYIEEITDGNMKTIENDTIMKELSEYANAMNLVHLLTPIFKPQGVVKV